MLTAVRTFHLSERAFSEVNCFSMVLVNLNVGLDMSFLQPLSLGMGYLWSDQHCEEVTVKLTWIGMVTYDVYANT